MNRVSSSVYRGALLSATLVALLIAGCGKKQINAPTPAPTPAPPPPPRPTVSLQASPTSVTKGDSTTLSWTSTDATQLTIAPEVGAVTAQGSTKVTPSDSTTYTITASGPGGSADATVRVTVNIPPPPVEQPKGPTDAEIFDRDVQDAYFDFNKADIRADAREALGKTADLLRRYPQFKVTIEGHCDERGSTEYNLLLGDRRASAVKNYLVQLGISADRLNTTSFGKEKPFCMAHDEACWQTNRRGHFLRVP